MLKASLQDNSNTDSHRDQARKVDGDGLVQSRYLSGNVKAWWVHEVWKPVEQFFVRHEIHPNTITWIGVFFTAIACILLAMNWLVVGGWLLFCAASFDFLDGRVARITGKSSQAGAFLDSVLDRYMDGMMFFALLWLFKDSWVSIVVLLALFGGMTTSYVRAKAESLGLQAKGGEMQRPERILYIGNGAVLSGYWESLNFPFREAGWSSPPYVLIAAVIFIAVVSNQVAIQRIRGCIQQLKAK